MATKEPGYVYILTNPSFREDWVKIGMTQNLEERLKNLDTTALPLPFKKFATLQTAKYQIAEKHAHPKRCLPRPQVFQLPERYIVEVKIKKRR